MTDESSIISGANITDHHIAMVRDDSIVETDIYTCTITLDSHHKRGTYILHI